MVASSSWVIDGFYCFFRVFVNFLKYTYFYFRMFFCNRKKIHNAIYEVKRNTLDEVKERKNWEVPYSNVHI